MSTKTKRGIIVRVVIAGVLLLNAAMVLLSWNNFRDTRDRLQSSFDLSISHEAATVTNGLSSVLDRLYQETRLLADLVQDEIVLEGNGRRETVRGELEKILYRFSNNHMNYFQVRFLTPEGREFIRINKTGELNEIVPPSLLQDKSSRYYFKEALKLEPGEVYLSPLDLNIENNVYEIPKRPVVRSAAVCRNEDGDLLGIIVVNLDFSYILSNFQKSDVMILNHEGIFFAAHDSSKLYFHTQEFPFSSNEFICNHCGMNYFIDKFTFANSAIEIYYAVPNKEKDVANILRAVLFREISLIAIVISFSLGTILAMLFYFEKKDALKLAEQSERLSAIGRTASLVVHDLKGPLTVIGGYSDMLLMIHYFEQCRECHNYSDKIKTAAKQQEDMIQEILDFSRGKEIELNLCEVDLQDFLHDRVEANKKYLGILDVNYDIHYEGMISIDVKRFKRVIDNLLKNAGEAMFEKGGKLTITSYRINSTVEITIKDSGPGIPKDVINSLFKIGSTHGKKLGTGLGLYSAKMIAEIHGGNIKVSSVEGQGASFTVKVPHRTPVEIPA